MKKCIYCEKETNKSDFYCDQCIAEEKIEQCDACEEFSESLTETTDGYSVCDACLDNEYVKCSQCEEDMPKEEAEHIPPFCEVLCEKCKGGE